VTETLKALCERAARHAITKYPGPVGEYLNAEIQTAAVLHWLAPAYRIRRLCEAVLADVEPEALPMPTRSRWISWSKSA
jgi:hypothetical protein